MENVTVKHKIRNPKDLRQWLELWTADVTDGTTYTITPSNKWNITVPVTNIINSGDSKNVDTLGGTSGALAKFSDDNTITNGPVINTNGAIDKFLNEKGQWINYTYKIHLEEETELAVQYVGTSPTVIGYSGKISLQQLINNTISTSQDIRLSSDLPIKLSIDPDQDNIQFSLEKFYGASYIKPSSITKDLIQDGAITSEKLAPDATITPDPSTLPNNTNETSGIVLKGEGHGNSFWGTNSSGEPSWQSISNNTDLNTAIRSKINTSITNGVVLKSDGASNKVWGVKYKDSNSSSPQTNSEPAWVSITGTIKDYEINPEGVLNDTVFATSIRDSEYDDKLLFFTPISVLSGATKLQKSVTQTQDVSIRII